MLKCFTFYFKPKLYFYSDINFKNYLSDYITLKNCSHKYMRYTYRSLDDNPLHKVRAK